MLVPPLILTELEYLQVINYESSTYLHNCTRWFILYYSTVILAIAVLYDYCKYCNCAWDNLHDSANNAPIVVLTFPREVSSFLYITHPH